MNSAVIKLLREHAAKLNRFRFQDYHTDQT